MQRNRFRWICLTAFLGMLCLTLPPESFCGAITMRITTGVAFPLPDKVAVNTDIGNFGDETAFHITVTTFLGDDAIHSDALGEGEPGKTIRYTCAFEETRLKPGRYILITRVNFTEKNGTPHSNYHFTPFTVRLGEEAKGKPALAVTASTPVINTKSLWGTQGNIRLALKNGYNGTLEPVIFFALPDGLKMDAGERAFSLRAGEEKTMDMPVSVTANLRGDIAYQMIIRYDADNIRHMEQVNGTIRLEERPVLFRIFLGIAAVLLWWA